MLRSICKQSGESVESVLKKKRKAAVGRICSHGGNVAKMVGVSSSDGTLVLGLLRPNL